MDHRHHAQIRRTTLLSAAAAFVAGLVFGWMLFAGMGLVPLWGPRGFGVALLAAAFLLAFVTSLLVTPLVRARVRHGRAPRLVASGPRLPRFAPLRALIVAGVVTSALLPPTVALLAVAGAGPWPPGVAALAHGLYAAIVALVVAPVTVRAAMRDDAPEGPPRLA